MLHRRTSRLRTLRNKYTSVVVVWRMTQCLALMLPALAINAGCFDVTMPPPASLGAPMPPPAIETDSWDIGIQEQVYAKQPFETALRIGRSLPMGAGPWSVELGGLGGAKYASLNPALGWSSDPLGVQGRWRLGGRLGAALGSGSLVGERFVDPFAGGSLHGLASWSWGWGDIGSLGISLGYGYTGFLRCFSGCVVLLDGDEGQVSERSYQPFRSPSAQLRADMPMSDEDPVALSVSCGLFPLALKGSRELVWSLGFGVHWRPSRRAEDCCIEM